MDHAQFRLFFDPAGKTLPVTCHQSLPRERSERPGFGFFRIFYKPGPVKSLSRAIFMQIHEMSGFVEHNGHFPPQQEACAVKDGDISCRTHRDNVCK